jgi:Family of unknown function (DUF6263)
MIPTASDRRTAVTASTLALALACVSPGALLAQAQPVALRIAPPVGETMRMRLDQRVEMSGTTRMQAGDSTATVVTTLLVISRTFVERRDRDATILLASTDSVAASSSGADSQVVARETRRALQGKRVRLRIAPDGATEVVGGDVAGNAELNALFAQMPSTLPDTPVTVGQSWSRVMIAPIGTTGAKAGGKLQATFRLDSLSRNGELAYVSLAGTLSRPPSSKGGWSTLTTSGSMTGGLVIDRRRGWISDARMTYTVRSTVTPTSASTAAAMRFRMKVTQWVRAVP